MSNGVLHKWHASLPVQTKTCAHCDKEFDNKYPNAKYCSRLCKLNAFKKRERDKKHYVCLFCGQMIECSHKSSGGHKTKFCSNKHKSRFHKAKRAGRKLKIRINDKITIETDKHDRVRDIILKYKKLVA
jgi:hypothetical protein